ncbi:MAG: FAD-dependent oxidoreductase, partial [Bacteroidetes bacterium]
MLGGVSVMVVDGPMANGSSASSASSGIINPVTGRRVAETWLADTLLPFALEAYGAIGALLRENLLEARSKTDAPTPLIAATAICDFFTAPDRQLTFEKKANQGSLFLSWPTHPQAWQQHLHYPFGYGIIQPAYLVQVQALLIQWRQYLAKKQLLLNQPFNAASLSITSQNIQYQDITAKAILFCDGAWAAESSYFKNVPFALNKGEALVVEIPDLPQTNILKKGLSLVPLGN